MKAALPARCCSGLCWLFTAALGTQISFGTLAYGDLSTFGQNLCKLYVVMHWLSAIFVIGDMLVLLCACWQKKVVVACACAFVIVCVHV